MNSNGTLFPVRKAWWYIPRSHLGFNDPWNGPKGTQGDGYYVAPNPSFGAEFTYHLSKTLESKLDKRKKKEKSILEKGKSVGFPGWDNVEGERRELSPEIILEVQDKDGNTVRRLSGPSKKGFHRVSWDLRFPSPNAISLGTNSSSGSGFLAAPGRYSVKMYSKVDGKINQLSDYQYFDVVPLRSGALATDNFENISSFWREYEHTVRRASAIQMTVANSLKKITSMNTALSQSTADVGDLDNRLNKLRTSLMDMDEDLSGNRSKMGPGEKTKPTAGSRLFVVQRVIEYATYGPTETASDNLKLAQQDLDKIESQLNQNSKDLNALSRRLEKAGAPWVEGEEIPKNN